MCIRDRLDTKSTELVSNYVALMAEIVGEVGDTNLDDATVDKARAVQQEFNERLDRLELDVAAESAVVRAVSYTHLRAHETVLDLVCRLLLEKKQTTQKKKNK